MNKHRVTVALLFSFCVLWGSAARADNVYVLDYWPGQGAYFNASSGEWDWVVARIQVMCQGGGCAEWDESFYYEGWYQSPVVHNDYHARNQWYGDMGHCCYDDQNFWNYFSGQLHAAWDCWDVRSDLNQEYVNQGQYWNANYIPLCGYGGAGYQAGPGYGPFPFSALNTGDSYWAVIRNDYLYNYMANWQAAAGYSLHVTSAYRNPNRNARIGGAPLSRHVFGDGVDVKPSSAPVGCMSPSSWTSLSNVAWGQGASYVEPYSQDCTHVHADLRGW
jgi:hypothetical protein